MKAVCILLLACQTGVVLSASVDTSTQVRWDLYHRSDGTLEYFKKTALKLPSRVR